MSSKIMHRYSLTLTFINGQKGGGELGVWKHHAQPSECDREPPGLGLVFVEVKDEAVVGFGEDAGQGQNGRGHADLHGPIM